MRGARDPISRLQRTIDCLPPRTKQAMLEGIRCRPIVAGAYTDGHGGICPMLAAHRHGGRTSLNSFARAWDAFARTRGGVRRATQWELAVLEELLIRSLACAGELDFETVIAEHRALWHRRREFEAAPSITAWRRSSPPASAGEAARRAW